MKLYAEVRQDGDKQFSRLNVEHVVARIMHTFRDTKMVVSNVNDQDKWDEEHDKNPDHIRLRVETSRSEAFILFTEDETHEIYNKLRKSFKAKKMRQEAAAGKPQDKPVVTAAPTKA